MEAVFVSSIPVNYCGLKDKAIDITRSRMLVKNILEAREWPNSGGFNHREFNSFQWPSYQGNCPFQGNHPNRQGFFNSNQGGQGNLFNQQCRPGFCPQGGGQGRPQYNSTNAPRWMANQPTPMDLDWAHASNRNWQGQGQGHGPSQSNTVTTGPLWGTTNNACFECGLPGHFTRNCPCHHQGCAGANLINFNNKFNSHEELEPVDQVTQMREQLNAMSLNNKAQLADEMGVAEDFPTAWLGQHWLSKVATTMCTYQLKNL